MMGLKGLAGVMKAKAPVTKAEPEEEEAEESESSGGSEMAFFKLASEASASGDHEAAAKAFKSGVKACLSSYGGKE